LNEKAFWKFYGPLYNDQSTTYCSEKDSTVSLPECFISTHLFETLSVWTDQRGPHVVSGLCFIVISTAQRKEIFIKHGSRFFE